jgi:hypothetical protein
MRRGSRRQDLARLILSFGAPAKNPCVTRDGQTLRKELNALVDMLVPKGDKGKEGPVQETGDVIAEWAGDAAGDVDVVNAYRRASASHCTADKRMCAFFAELAPAVLTASGELRDTPARTVKPRAQGGVGVRATTKYAIGKQMEKIRALMENLTGKIAGYQQQLDDLDVALQGAQKKGRGPRGAAATAAKAAKAAQASSVESSSVEWEGAKTVHDRHDPWD